MPTTATTATAARTAGPIAGAKSRGTAATTASATATYTRSRRASSTLCAGSTDQIADTNVQPASSMMLATKAAPALATWMPRAVPSASAAAQNTRTELQTHACGK